MSKALAVVLAAYLVESVPTALILSHLMVDTSVLCLS
jgi:hypothetical protein